NWLGIAGPGVANLGLDGTAADKGPNSAGPDSGQVTVPDSGTTGTWIDETDVRPTMLYLTGLRDDYQTDGRVISQVLARPAPALAAPATVALGDCYKQLNSSVGEFGTATLQASTKAIESNSPGDATYQSTTQALTGLERARDALTGKIKVELAAAAQNKAVTGAASQTATCQSLISSAKKLAAAS
ncbi:MAG TPA: hypothetical protein VE343_02525, partial [Streptosporangiaceae bacterium]|nr:hypothetical protein [Streptosporangiaceae bacterium]